MVSNLGLKPTGEILSDISISGGDKLQCLLGELLFRYFQSFLHSNSLVFLGESADFLQIIHIGLRHISDSSCCSLGDLVRILGKSGVLSFDSKIFGQSYKSLGSKGGDHRHSCYQYGLQ